MSLQEKIRTLLREQSEEKAEIKPPIFFRRRVTPDEMDKDFRHSVVHIINHFRKYRNLFNFNDYGVDKFKRAVIIVLIDEYSDILSDSDDFPYDEIYDYLHNHYESEMEDEYNELVNDLQENINESTFFRRRSDVKKVKDLLPYFVNDVFYDSENFEEFKYKLTLIALEYYLSSNHDLSWEDLPEQEDIEFINTLSEVLNGAIKELYNTKI